MQFKRVVRILPTILVTTLLLCGVMGISAWAVLDKEDTKEENARIRVGLVGEVDTYMGYDLYGLINLMATRFGIKFVPVEEKDAPGELRAGRIAAYAMIPEGLVEDVEMGRNDKQIEYVAAEGQKGIGSTIMDEVIASLSQLITASQSAIYGMQHFLLDTGRGEEIVQATDELNLIYIEILMDIFSICRLETTGLSNRVSAVGYYVCSIVIVFLLLCSLNCSQLFTKKNMELPRLMASRGQGALCQVLGEYLAYLAMLSLFFGMLVAALGTAVGGGYLAVPEWELAGRGDFVEFGFRLLPAVFAIAAMQFLLYEAAGGVVSGILAQFLAAVGMSYVAGCFYPLSLFPKVLQVIGGLSPAGMALRYADKCMLGEGALPEAGALLLYAVLMLLSAVQVRKRRMAVFG